MTVSLRFKGPDEDAFNVHFQGENYYPLLSSEDIEIVERTPPRLVVPECKVENVTVYISDSLFNKFLLICVAEGWYLDELDQGRYDVSVRSGDLSFWTKAEVTYNGAHCWVTPHFDHQKFHQAIENYEEGWLSIDGPEASLKTAPIEQETNP